MPIPTAEQLNNNESNRLLEEIRALRKRVEYLERRPAARTNFANASSTNVIVGTGDPFDINNPFTGTAILFPAYQDASGNYHIFGMNNGVVQWGANSDDGKIYAGGGDVKIDQYGINFANQEGAIYFVDSAGNPYFVQINIAADDFLEFANSVGDAGMRFFIDDAAHNVNVIEFDGNGNIDLQGGEYMQEGQPLTYGWFPVTEAWTRTGNHTFTVSGDLTLKYRKNAKLHYNDGASSEYGVVGSSSHAAGTTTVNLIPNTDYAMAAATITNTLISYIENPESFPHFFNFDAAPGGFSVVPSSPSYKWTAMGRGIFIAYVEPNDGTSNLTTFTATAPIAPILNVAAVAGTLVDNGAILTTAGRVTMVAGSTAITFRSNMGTGAWTNANGKRAVAYWWYEF